MPPRYPETMSLLKTIPPALDNSVELDQILNFTLNSIEKRYGFEGVGIQLVDYEKRKIKFTKIHIPVVSQEALKEVELTEIPLNPSGGICFFVVNQNFTVYFEDIRDINLDLYYMAEYDAKFIRLLNHRTHLIIPVSFENQVVALIHFSSYAKTIPLTKDQIEEIKNISFSIGRVFYKTYFFKKIYEENQKLVLDLIKAREAREIFLAGISHELKTPLNAVIGFSEYMTKAKKLEEPKVRQMAHTIYKNGQTLLSLIQEIIEIYKISSGKIQVEKTEFSTIQVLQDVADSLSSLYLLKKHRLRIEGGNFVIHCDYKRLSQILTNLISNAIKYTPEKGEITVRAMEKGNEVCFQVEDNGMGIDAEEQKDLFLPFRRGKRAYLSEEGSGLGLFVTSELVRVLSGEISYTAKTQGSIFTVKLPR